MMRSFPKSSLLALLAGLATVSTRTALAQYYYWTADTNNIWDTNSFNWAGPNWIWVNGSSNIAIFPNTFNITLGTNITANGVHYYSGRPLSTIHGGSSTLTLQSGNFGLPFIQSDSELALNVPIGGANGFVKGGASRLTLLRPCSASGTVRVATGQLLLNGGNNTLSFDTRLQIDSGAGVFMSAQQQALTGLSGDGYLISTLATGSASEVVLTIQSPDGANDTFEGYISDNGAVPLRIRKLGTGTQWIRGSMGTYHHGGTSIGGGIVGTTRDDALGNGSVTIFPGATWMLGININPFNPLMILGPGAPGTHGALQSYMGPAFYAGPITASDNFTIASAPGSPLTINSTISCGAHTATFNAATPSSGGFSNTDKISVRSINSSGSVIKTGLGYLDLTAASTFPLLSLTQGTVRVFNGMRLATTVIDMGTSVSNSYRMLELNTSATIAGLVGTSSTGRITRTSPAFSLTLDVPAGACSYAGGLTEFTGALIKSGPGQQIFTQSANAAGPIVINQGAITANSGLGAPSFTLAGADAVLNGLGAIFAPVTINSGTLGGPLTMYQPVTMNGGAIAPRGTGFPNVFLRINSNLTATGGTISLLNDPSHNQIDLINVTGNANLQNVSLEYLPIGTVFYSSTAMIPMIYVNGATTGHFVGLPEGERLFSIDGMGNQPAWYIYYHAGSGNLTSGNNIIVSPIRSPRLLLNGSVEQGGAIGTLNIGSTALSGWTVTGSGVQIANAWQGLEGPRSIHLQANGAGGGIRQTITTVPGRRYALSFSLAGNPDGGSPIKHIRAGTGSTSSDFTFNTTGMTRTSMGYTEKTVHFVATGASAAIELFGMDSASAFGAVVDNIRVTYDPCAADFNRDDVVDFFDYLDFVQAFSASQPAADFNHDSVIDLFDYLDFVDRFSSGC